jgi:hypothetical protein
VHDPRPRRRTRMRPVLGAAPPDRHGAARVLGTKMLLYVSDYSRRSGTMLALKPRENLFWLPTSGPPHGPPRSPTLEHRQV